jgi:GT2 family glycosyltransferase
MQEPEATVVIVPRDHFSDTRESLESLLESTPDPIAIVYVDGGSPPRTAGYLRERARTARFGLIRYDHYLIPNQARNIGAAGVKTRYIAFVDNDVVFTPNWLQTLVECGNATGAAVVGPVNYERRPLLQTVHFAGGDARIVVTQENGRQHRRLVDRIHKAIPESPVPTDAAEFHCMLVRTDVLRQLGGLDENMLSTRENIDLCLAVREIGGQVYLEPRSRITYLPPDPLSITDVPYFALRWSDLWDMSSFRHLIDKWDLDEDQYFERQYANLGWRRRAIMMRGSVLRWLVSSRIRSVAERALRPLEQRVNAALARRHAKRHGVRLRPAKHQAGQ